MSFRVRDPQGYDEVVKRVYDALGVDGDVSYEDQAEVLADCLTITKFLIVQHHPEELSAFLLDRCVDMS